MRLAQRALVALSQVALCLPFVAVTDCNTGVRTVHGGVGVYGEASSGWAWLAVGLVFALILAIWPWSAGDSPGSTAPGLGLRAVAAGVALGSALTVPVLAFLFDEVRPHVGWVLQLACWGLLYVGYLGGAARSAARHADGEGVARPEQAAVVLVMAVPFLVSLATHTADDPSDAWDALASLVVSVPLVLALVGVGRRGPDAPRWRLAVWTVAVLWLVGWTAAITG